MASLEELRNERIKKLNLLKEKGFDAYPVSTQRDFTLEEVREDFSKLSKRKKALFLAGRIIALRKQGGVIFFNFDDGTGVFQGFLKKEDENGSSFDDFDSVIDVGDFVEVSGTLFLTKREEQTVLVNTWKMLAKTLRPLPEKWHGLKDVEEKFRKRYLDILMSKETRERFLFRSKMIQAVRSYLEKAGYLEVETPTLQPLYGGASAEPFSTHHNTLDVDLYLRISNELYLKRLLIGNIPKVFEIYKAFRNEGIDVTHYPEFTMVEFYESYGNATLQMAFVEKLIQTLVQQLTGKSSFPFNKNDISVELPFKRISYWGVLGQYALIPDIEHSDASEIFLRAQQLGVSIDRSDSREKMLDAIFKKACRPKIIQPTFVTDYPALAFPLAKRKEDNKNFADAFQLIMGGIELVKGFSELNDPFDQRERFLDQEKNRERGDKEAQKIDEDFLEALEYGMPPAGGVGIGIDRLVMLLTDTHNIKDIILFPTMKSKE